LVLLAKGSSHPVVSSEPLSPLPWIYLPLLHTLVPHSSIKLLNPRIKKEKGGGEKRKKRIRRKKYGGDGKRVGSK